MDRCSEKIVGIALDSFRYFDIETTGLDRGDFEITLVNLDGKILSRKDSSEKSIVKATLLWLMEAPDHPIIGKNLIFDIGRVIRRTQAFGFQKEFGFSLLRWIEDYKHLDMKDVAILINGGEFRGYQHHLDSENKPSGKIAVEWAKNGEWDKLIEYSEQERLQLLNRLYQIIEQFKKGL